MPPKKWSLSLWEAIAVTTAYLFAAQTSLWTGARDPGPLEFTGGVGMAILLMRGWRFLPAIVIASLASSLWILWNSGAPALSILCRTPVLGLADAAEAIGGAWLVVHFAGGRGACSEPANIIKFVAVVAAACLVFGGAGAVLASFLPGPGQGRELETLWLSSGLGKTVGTLLVTPLILAWSRPTQRVVLLRRKVEAVVLLLVLVLLCWIIFNELFEARTRSVPIAFLVLPLVLWSALRFGERGATLVCFVLAFFAAAATMHGRGPFALTSQSTGSLLLLQNYIGVVSVMSLLLTADVRQRERIEVELRASEQRYRDLFESNPQPMWIFEYDSLHLVAANRAALQEYGYSTGEISSLRLPDLWVEQERPGMLQLVHEARNGLEMQGETRHVRKDGRVFEVKVSSRNLLFDGKKAAMVLSEDITEQKRAEKQTAAFSDLARRLSAVSSASEAARLVMGTADALFGWDACIFELCSEGTPRLKTVLAVDTIEGKRSDVTRDMSDKRHGVHTLATLQQGARLILRPEPAEFAADMLPFGDRSRPSASLMFAPVRADQEPIAVLSVQSYRHHAYTESDLRLLQALADNCGSALKRVRAEDEVQRLNRELRQKVEELQSVFNVAPAGIVLTTDPEGRHLVGNPAWAAMVGAPVEGQPGLPDCRFYRDGAQVPLSELPLQVATREELPIKSQELDLVRGDGRVVSCYVAASPLFDDSGQVRGSLGVFVDVTDLKQAQAALRESSERLRLALTAGRMGTWTAEIGGSRAVEISPELEYIFGLEPGQFGGSAASILELVNPDDRSLVRSAIRDALTREGDYELEFRFLPKRGHPGWLFVRGRAYGGQPGEPTRIAGVAMDITARKHAEEEILRLNSELEFRVRQRTAQLESINKELEAFSYSVSHDLRAPLRSVRGFSEVLLERYKPVLDERGQEFLRRVCQSSQQMDRLIEDLLKLSRVGRSELQRHPVDLSALAQSIVTELQQSQADRQVTLTITPGLHAVGDERLLRIVLENLLRNAWKFSARQPRALIEFGAVQEPEPAFFVKDNGAGFDMAYADKLFGVFQRLHSASDFPGTGVGLATVQRIIGRHGGRVWAEAAPERGATFYFTLPSEPS